MQRLRRGPLESSGARRAELLRYEGDTPGTQRTEGICKAVDSFPHAGLNIPSGVDDLPGRLPRRKARQVGVRAAVRTDFDSRT